VRRTTTDMAISVSVCFLQIMASTNYTFAGWFTFITHCMLFFDQWAQKSHPWDSTARVTFSIWLMLISWKETMLFYRQFGHMNFCLSNYIVQVYLQICLWNNNCR